MILNTIGGGGYKFGGSGVVVGIFIFDGNSGLTDWGGVSKRSITYCAQAGSNSWHSFE